MRIGLLADIHANLPALEAAYASLTAASCDVIVNLGDAITIGPYPAETLDFLRARGISSIAGNHEDDAVLGFTDDLDRRMGDGERKHYLWTHAQLSQEDVSYLASLPHTLEIPSSGGSVLCVHYYLADGRVADNRFEVVRTTLEGAFGQSHDLIAFGHTHHGLVDNERAPCFANPGSAGLHHNGGPTIMLVDVAQGSPPACRFLPVEYDPGPTLREFDKRDVPDTDFIRRSFFPDL